MEEIFLWRKHLNEGHLCMEVKYAWRRPMYGGNKNSQDPMYGGQLCKEGRHMFMEDTSVSRTHVYQEHLYMEGTCVSRTHVYIGDPYVWGTPVYGGSLCMEDKCIWRTLV